MGNPFLAGTIYDDNNPENKFANSTNPFLNPGYKPPEKPKDTPLIPNSSISQHNPSVLERIGTFLGGIGKSFSAGGQESAPVKAVSKIFTPKPEQIVYGPAPEPTYYKPQTLPEKIAYGLGEQAAEWPLWLAGEGVAAKGLSLAGKGVTKVAPKLIPAIEKTVPKALPYAEASLRGAATSALVSPVESIMAGDTPQQARERATGLILGGAILPPAFMGATKVLGKGISALPKPLTASRKAEFPKVELPKVEAKPIEKLAKDVPVFDPTKIKDIGNFKAYTSDVYRITRDALGEKTASKLLKPFDVAKEANIDMQNNLLSRLKKEVVDGLGIKKGSKESALVQRYGEGKITLDELKQQAPGKWQNIVKADQWFRKEYDNLLDQVNASRKQVYPNAEARAQKIEQKIEQAKNDKTLSPAERSETLKSLGAQLEDATRGKIIPKRQDYYRHFQELAEGFQGLKNIFDSPANINTQLIGTSEFTKPKTKWASFAQKRLGDKTTEDAVGGFLNYVPAASYATHIDPQIARFRDITQFVRDATADTHNADTFIGFLDKFANDLAGKTNPADRFLQDSLPGGRKTFAALSWLNNRIKANVVLGKASSALAQTANIPTGIAYAKQYSIPGLVDSVKAIAGPTEAMRKSSFLKERYGGIGSKIYRQFDTKLLDKPKDMAVWLMETADKVGTTFVWNSSYAKALAEKVPDPIRAADIATRNIVAGRGVGEVPILQKSKVFQLIAPFQLEVANLWHVQKDFINAKDFGGLIALYLLNWGYNNIMENVRGNKVVFDPVGATVDAVKEKGVTPTQRAGRILGEFAGNIPLMQTVTDVLYPEYGVGPLPSRKEFFGSNDPTRYGSSLLIARGIQDPLSKVVLPFGGEQLKKTLEGVRALSNQGKYPSPTIQQMLQGQFNPKDKLSFPIRPTLPNEARSLLFGPNATSEAQKYYEQNLRPLSPDQTKKVQNSSDAVSAYNKLMQQRRLDTLNQQLQDVQKDKTLTSEEKAKKINSIKAQLEEVKKGWGV